MWVPILQMTQCQNPLRNWTSQQLLDYDNFREISFCKNQGTYPFIIPIISSSDYSVDRLTKTFPSLLESASRADKNLDWQLAALDAFSIWLLRATRSSNPSILGSYITPSEWETLVSLHWIRWASAPNSTAIQKILKETFSKTLVLQRLLFPNWKEREIELLERVVNFTGIDMKIQCYLIEVLVRRASGGAKRVLEIRND